MNRIIEIFERYKSNNEQLNLLSVELVTFHKKDKWSEFYKNIIQKHIELYRDNSAVFCQLDEVLEQPLTEEFAQCLYDQIILLYECDVRDYLFFTKVLDELLPYYENSSDISKKIWLYSIEAYEINEIKRRQFSVRKMDFSYYDKIIEFGKDYLSIPEKKDRLRIWIAFYNKICGGLDHRCISVREAYDCAAVMNEIWFRPEVQELDGQDADFLDIIKQIRIEMIDSIFLLDPKEKDLSDRFMIAVTNLYNNEITLVKSEYELPALLYAGYLYVEYCNNKRDINMIFDDYMDYYLYRCITYQNEDSPTEDSIEFYSTSALILDSWAKRGVDHERVRKMVGNFMTLAEKRWRNIKGDLWPSLNRLMKTLCNLIMTHGSTEVNAEQCLIHMVISRDFNLFLHSKTVEKIAVMISDAVYDKKPELFTRYQSMTKPELLNKIGVNALLHDCGKTDMYELIYLNNRPWTPEEQEYICSHPTRGAEYLATFSDLKQYCDVIQGHHKSYDGKNGYPQEYDNTKAENKLIVDIIALADRIEHEVDQFFGQGIEMDFHKLVEELKAGSGTQYHPEVVEVILEDKKICEQLKDVLNEKNFEELYEHVRGFGSGSIHQSFDDFMKDVVQKYREYVGSGNYDEFKPSLDKLFEIAARENTNRSLGIAYYFMMRYYFWKKDYTYATNCCHEAVRYLENTEEYFYLSQSYNTLGVLMEFQGNAENGIGYYLKSVDYGLRCKDNRENLVTAYNNIANLFMMSRNYERALYYYSLAVENATEFKYHLVSILGNISYCHVCLSDKDNTKKVCEQIEELRKDIGYEDFDIHVYLAYAYFFLGDMTNMEKELCNAKNDLFFLHDYIMYVAELYVYLDLLEALGRFEEIAGELEKYIEYFEKVHVNSQIFGKMVQRRIKCGHMMHDMKSVGYYGKYLYQNAERNKKARVDLVLQIEKSYLENIKVQRKQREIIKQNEKLAQEVVEAQHVNESKSNFLTSMSHEIRTPIHAILGLDEMILRESTDETILQYATDIQNAGKTLVGIISDVLDISKMESGKMEIIPEHYQLIDFIQELKNMIESRAKDKGLAFQIHCDKNIPKGLYGDDLRVKQVVLNILSNAVKYTKEGSVDFSIQYEKMDAEHIMLKMSVKDTGMGMKKEDLEKLSTPFVRFDGEKNKNIEGTGLGMSIVKSLVKEMNGIWTVESEYGKGSVFYVEIPQTVVDWTEIGELFEHRKASQGDKKAALFTAPNAEILLVDDNAVNLKVVSSLLKRTKVKVTCAKSGRECLELCKDKKFDMILLDHRMPELDGVETLALLKQAKGLNSETPVIALTANAVSGAADYYRENGFDELVTKPVDHLEMERKMKNLLPPDLVE